MGLKWVNPELSEKRRRAGRLGGRATSSLYGREHYAAMGRAGGRPRSLDYAALTGQAGVPGRNKKEEVASQ
jgi:general stress protein YciG